MLHARSVPTSKSFLKVMENQGVMAWSALLLFFFRLQRGLGGYKTFDCPRRTAKSRTGFCTPPGLNQFLSIIFIYSCECGSGKKWSRGDGRGREPGLHRVPGSGRYKSLAAVGRVGLGVAEVLSVCLQEEGFQRAEPVGRRRLLPHAPHAGRQKVKRGSG